MFDTLLIITLFVLALFLVCLQLTDTCFCPKIHNSLLEKVGGLHYVTYDEKNEKHNFIPQCIDLDVKIIPSPRHKTGCLSCFANSKILTHFFF